MLIFPSPPVTLLFSDRVDKIVQNQTKLDKIGQKRATLDKVEHNQTKLDKI